MSPSAIEIGEFSMRLYFHVKRKGCNIWEIAERNLNGYYYLFGCSNPHDESELVIGPQIPKYVPPREKGYYWAKLAHVRDPEIYFYTPSMGTFLGVDEMNYAESNFEKIGPKLEEQW
jgi:hypothetical protein